MKKWEQDRRRQIARRLLASRSEIEHAPEFDYIVINEVFDLALSQLLAIVTATACGTARRRAPIGLIQTIRDQIAPI